MSPSYHMLWLLLLVKLKREITPILVSGVLQRCKPLCSVVIKIADLSKVILTSMVNSHEVFDNIHMLWMCICTSYYYVSAALFDQALESYPQNSGLLLSGKLQCSVVIEAAHPSKMAPTSMVNTYEVFDNIHML